MLARLAGGAVYASTGGRLRPRWGGKRKIVARGNKLFSEKMLYIIRKTLTLQGRGDEQAGTGQRKTL